MKQMSNRLRTLWGDASIRAKLIWATLSLVLIPCVLFTVSFALVSVKNVRANQRSFIQNVVEQAAENVDNRVDNITYLLYDLSTDESLQLKLRRWCDAGISESVRLQTRSEIIRTVMRKISKISEVSGVCFEFDGFSEIPISSMPDACRKSLTNEEIRSGMGSNLWQPAEPDSGVIPVSKEIYDLTYQTPLAHMTVSIGTSYFLSGLEEAALGPNGSLFLVDVGGALLGPPVPPSVEAAWRAERGDGPPENGVTLVHHALRCGHWSLLGAVDTGSQRREVYAVLLEIFVVFAMVGCVLVTICIQLSKTISRPIRDLQNCMEQVSAGNFQVVAPARYRDEIGDLRRHFNKMAREVDQLIKRVYLEENLRQKAQIKTLQMQINPHFLYNTLDTINWMAETNGQRDIAAVSRALAALMRYSLRDQEYVSVEEELDAVENYMKIQLFRYGDSLRLVTQIDEEVLYESIPKNVLLPLVENAILHGLKDVCGEKTVTVTGAVQNDTIRITVQDNGSGIDAARIGGLLHGEAPPDDGRHLKIGLRNVNERLQLIYGERYGLDIRNGDPRGCIVTITLPAGGEPAAGTPETGEST